MQSRACVFVEGMRCLRYTGTSIIITGKKIFYILDGELPACLTKNLVFSLQSLRDLSP